MERKFCFDVPLTHMVDKVSEVVDGGAALNKVEILRETHECNKISMH